MSEFVEGRRWIELSVSDVFLLHAGTSLFSDEAFRYFMPAFMTAALTDKEEADVAVEYFAWCYLPYSTRDKPIRTTRLLTVDQIDVLCDWLEWYVEDEIVSNLAYTRSIKPSDAFHAETLRELMAEEEDRLQRYEAVVARLRIERDLSE